MMIFDRGTRTILSKKHLTNPVTGGQKIASKLWFLPLASFLLSLSFNAKSEEFAQLIQMIANHPAVLASESSSGAAMADIDRAEAGNSLKVSTGISAVGYSGQPGAVDTPFSPNIRVSKLLYDHGRTDLSVAGTTAIYHAQQAQTKVTREGLNKQLLSLYSAALSDRLVGLVLDEQIEALKNLRQRIQAIAGIDPGRASEVNQIDSRLQSAIASRGARETSEQQTWRQVTELLQQDVTLTQELPDLRKNFVLPNDLSAMKIMLENNPSLVAARFKREEAEAAMRLASKWNRPNWTVEVNVSSPKNRDSGNIEFFRTAMVQLSTDMNLFDGGSGSATSRSAQLRLEAAESDVDSTERSLRQELERLWVSLPLREQQLNTIANQVQVTDQMWKSGETQFFAGRRSLTDLISFSSDYYSSLASYEEQRVQYLATQWQIIAALGDLSSVVKKHPKLVGKSIRKADSKDVKQGNVNISTNQQVSPEVVDWIADNTPDSNNVTVDDSKSKTLNHLVTPTHIKEAPTEIKEGDSKHEQLLSGLRTWP
ncbi:TolC family protein [Budvicia diplopodorum]|uniref:TolC family protein n=1 Tax=Budvicia diplopodorum TaxID=1119056 RepID=UPI00135C7087|nr:TolC family protein [Budvicia diplopodorum]